MNALMLFVCIIIIMFLVHFLCEISDCKGFKDKREYTFYGTTETFYRNGRMYDNNSSEIIYFVSDELGYDIERKFILFDSKNNEYYWFTFSFHSWYRPEYRYQNIKYEFLSESELKEKLMEMYLFEKDYQAQSILSSRFKISPNDIPSIYHNEYEKNTI